jgi:RNA polymerase sigma-70 factor (ECF subfamily)
MADEFKFDEAFERARPYLRLLAQTNLGERLKQKVDASDVVQQALLKAHEDRDQFKGESEQQLVAWLKTILKNRLIDMARHWKGQKRDIDRDVNLQQKVDDSFRRVDDWLAMSQTSPSMAAQGNEALLLLSTAVEKLPDDLREVVVMHHLQGMKLVEISKAVGCDETTVGRRLFRGMKQLGQLMES